MDVGRWSNGNRLMEELLVQSRLRLRYVVMNGWIEADAQVNALGTVSHMIRTGFIDPLPNRNGKTIIDVVPCNKFLTIKIYCVITCLFT